MDEMGRVLHSGLKEAQHPLFELSSIDIRGQYLTITLFASPSIYSSRLEFNQA